MWYQLCETNLHNAIVLLAELVVLEQLLQDIQDMPETMVFLL